MFSEKRLTAAAIGVILSCGSVLALFFVQGTWIRDLHGHPLVTDFLPVFTAGKLAMSGHAAAAYDWRGFHVVQEHLIGHPFAGYLGWHYPPLYFLVAMALASLPYTVAFLGWTAGTLAAFCAIVGAIARRPSGIAFALALPPVLACALVGQNGFFTAALLGAMLLCLPTRPVLAGVFLALLTFKPQFGILLPFALMAGGYWRSVGTAVILTLCRIGIVYTISPDAFLGFFQYLPQTAAAVLGDGASGWQKLQSIYAVVRLLGGSDALGWAVQIAVILLSAGFCRWLWRQSVPYALKAAGLSLCILLATPYLDFYDLAVLAVPLAFLMRDRALDAVERVLLMVLFLVLGAVVFQPDPWGLLACLLVMGLIVRRTVQNSASSSSIPARSFLAASIHSIMSGSVRIVSQ